MWNNCAGRYLLAILTQGLFLVGTTLALGLFLMGTTGCGVRWMHADKGPDQLDIDENVCRQLAEQAGLDRSMTGREPVLAAYYVAYTDCMVGKGWVPKKGVEAAKKQMALKIGEKNLVEKTGDNQYAFEGRTVELPAGVTQVNLGRTVTTDTTYQQTLTFQSKGPWGDGQGEMIFQIAREPSSFDGAPYPVAPPFFVYDQGPLASDETWRAFAGPTKDNQWMLGLGSRWHLNSKKRVITTVFVNEDPPDDAPLPPSRITPTQSRTLDDMVTTFIPWMETMGRKNRLRRLFEFNAKGLSTSFE